MAVAAKPASVHADIPCDSQSDVLAQSVQNDEERTFKQSGLWSMFFSLNGSGCYLHGTRYDVRTIKHNWSAWCQYNMTGWHVGGVWVYYMFSQ